MSADEEPSRVLSIEDEDGDRLEITEFGAIEFVGAPEGECFIVLTVTTSKGAHASVGLTPANVRGIIAFLADSPGVR